MKEIWSFFVPTLNEAGSEFGWGAGANEKGESMLARECVLLRKWPSALSSSTGGGIDWRSSIAQAF